MLTDTEERMLQYIQDHANANVRGKTFFRMTDVLEDAFLLTEDKAPGFSIKLDEEMYNKFLQSDLEELDKQYERFLNLNNN